MFSAQKRFIRANLEAFSEGRKFTFFETKYLYIIFTFIYLIVRGIIKRKFYAINKQLTSENIFLLILKKSIVRRPFNTSICEHYISVELHLKCYKFLATLLPELIIYLLHVNPQWSQFSVKS